MDKKYEQGIKEILSSYYLMLTIKGVWLSGLGFVRILF